MNKITSIICGSIIGTCIGVSAGTFIGNIYSCVFIIPTFHEKSVQKCYLSEEQPIKDVPIRDEEDITEKIDIGDAYENCEDSSQRNKNTLDKWIMSDENFATVAKQFAGMKDIDLSDCPPFTNWTTSDENLAMIEDKFAGIEDMDISDFPSLTISINDIGTLDTP